MTRSRLHALLSSLFALGLIVWSAGCGDSIDAEFQSYGELKRDLPPQTDQTGEAAVRDEPAAPSGEDAETATADPTTVAGNGGEPKDDATAVARIGDPPRPPADLPTPDTAGDESNGRPAGPGPPSGEPAAEPASDEDVPAPRVVQVLIPHREFRAEGPEGALRVSYDDFDLLKVLNMEPVTADAPSLMPDWLKDLDGQRIRVRGFMYPTFQESGIERFILARDNDICCFGRDPKIYDLVRVTLRQGTTTRYIEGRPFDVVGTFRIRPADDDGKLYQLYHLDDALVIQR